jgi:hypothetical protein
MILVLKSGKARMWFLVVVTLVYLLCAGCASIPKSLSFSRSPADRAIQEDNIRESVFRYRIEQVKGNGPFFLSIDGKDPSDAFMARFATLKKKIKKASGSYIKKELLELRDRETDEKAISYSVGSISWMSLDRVEVRGGMYCGGLCADGGIYRLTKKDGRWVVESYEVQVVS